MRSYPLFSRLSELESVKRMPLTAGTRIGPTKSWRPSGAGGMGEVYRAHDTKLGRDFAIKVLPAAVADNPESLARFEGEAKVLALLNHPNIAHIHGVEDRALVMELADGVTPKGPMPLGKALEEACIGYRCKCSVR